MTTHYEARLVGGPADGRVYAIPTWQDSIVIAHLPDTRLYGAEMVSGPIIPDRIEYVPVGVTITYAPRFTS